MDKIMKILSSLMEKIADRFPSFKEKLMGLFSYRYVKIAAAILCALLVIGLVRCSVNTGKEEATPTQPTEIATEAPTEAPTEGSCGQSRGNNPKCTNRVHRAHSRT